MNKRREKNPQFVKIDRMVGGAFTIWLLAWFIGMLFEENRQIPFREFTTRNACIAFICTAVILLLLQAFELCLILFKGLQTNKAAMWLARRYNLCLDERQINLKAQSILLPVEFVLLFMGFFLRFKLYLPGSIIACGCAAIFLYHYKQRSYGRQG